MRAASAFIINEKIYHQKNIYHLKDHYSYSTFRSHHGNFIMIPACLYSERKNFTFKVLIERPVIKVPARLYSERKKNHVNSLHQHVLGTLHPKCAEKNVDSVQTWH